MSLLLSSNRAEAAHRLRWTFQVNASVNSLAFSPQDNLLAVGTDVPEGRKGPVGLYLLSAKKGQIAYRFATRGDTNDVAFTTDGRLLLSTEAKMLDFDRKPRRLRQGFLSGFRKSRRGEDTGSIELAGLPFVAFKVFTLAHNHI